MASPRLASPSSLKFLHIPGVKATQVHWGPHHATPLNAIPALDHPNHPRHTLVLRKWLARQDPLWWNCIVTVKVGGPKRVVRGWLMKRLRVAFRETLNSKGYAVDGSRLSESVDAGRGNLVGSIQFRINEELFRTSWVDLRKETDLVLESIEKQQQQHQKKKQNWGTKKEHKGGSASRLKEKPPKYPGWRPIRPEH